MLIFGAWLVASTSTLGALFFGEVMNLPTCVLCWYQRLFFHVSAGPRAPAGMHSPALGKADAPVVTVEFLDPACETCREFFPLAKQVMAANPDRIRLVPRYAPFHKGSDKVVAVLEAARRQGKFWLALEALLAAQTDWAREHQAHLDLVWRHLANLGLNLEQLRADMDSPATARVIAQDLEDARVLNVTKTPEFFVNRRPLPSFGYDQLKESVGKELASAIR